MAPAGSGTRCRQPRKGCTRSGNTLPPTTSYPAPSSTRLYSITRSHRLSGQAMTPCRRKVGCLNSGAGSCRSAESPSSISTCWGGGGGGGTRARHPCIPWFGCATGRQGIAKQERLHRVAGRGPPGWLRPLGGPVAHAGSWGMHGDLAGRGSGVSMCMPCAARKQASVPRQREPHTAQTPSPSTCRATGLADDGQGPEPHHWCRSVRLNGSTWHAGKCRGRLLAGCLPRHPEARGMGTQPLGAAHGPPYEGAHPLNMSSLPGGKSQRWCPGYGSRLASISCRSSMCSCRAGRVGRQGQWEGQHGPACGASMPREAATGAEQNSG